MWAIVLVTVYYQITMTRHLGANPPKNVVQGALPPDHHLGSYNYICIVIGIRDWLSYYGGTFYMKEMLDGVTTVVRT